MITPHKEQAVTLVKVIQTINELNPPVLALLDHAYSIFAPFAEVVEANFDFIDFETEVTVKQSLERLGCKELYMALVQWIQAMKYDVTPQLLEFGYELLSARDFLVRTQVSHHIAEPFLMLQKDILNWDSELPVFAEFNRPPTLLPFDATRETRAEYVLECQNAISSYVNAEILRLTGLAYKGPEMWKRQEIERQTLIDLARMRMKGLDPAQLIATPETIDAQDSRAEIKRKEAAASRDEKDVVRPLKRMMEILGDDSYWPNHGLKKWKTLPPSERVTVYADRIPIYSPALNDELRKAQGTPIQRPKKINKLSEEQKLAFLVELEQGHKTIKELCQEYGCSRASIPAWKKKYAGKLKKSK